MVCYEACGCSFSCDSVGDEEERMCLRKLIAFVRVFEATELEWRCCGGIVTVTCCGECVMLLWECCDSGSR